MSIIPYTSPETDTSVRVDLLPGTLDRARRAAADAEALLTGPGPFMADPQAPVVLGRLQAAVEELLRSIHSGVAA